MSFGDREFVPPTPVGEPYRADPSDAAPFVSESPGGVAPSAGLPTQPPVGQSPYYGPDRGLQPPIAPSSAPLTPEERFARTAFWTGVASIFIFNVVLGPIAIVMGLLAIRRGQRQKGRSAALLGLVGTVLGAALLVLAANGVIPDVNELLEDMRTKQ